MRRVFHRNLHFQTFYYHNLYKIAYYHLQNHILKPLIQFFLHYFSLLEQLHDKSVVKPQVVKEQVQEDQQDVEESKKDESEQQLLNKLKKLSQ